MPEVVLDGLTNRAPIKDVAKIDLVLLGIG
jgi:hypothetical protein